MSLTDRDKKLVMVLVPLLVLVGYWFLVLSPQRSELSSLDEKQATAEATRDESMAAQQRLSGSRNRYASDYATVVRLGKAIPSTLDMPSLLVQLESAAKGTGIDFDSITVGQRAAAPAASGTGSSSTGGGSAPVEAGGQQAQSGPGKATEQANEGAQTANQASGASGGSTSSSSGSSSAGAGTSSVPGLDTVPLTFKFEGSYFDLADFLHRVKRFVRVANDDIRVKGRLMTIDGVTLTTENFPSIKAQLNSTIYLSPKSQGATGGATSQGPAATPAAAPAGAGSSSNANSSSTQSEPPQ